MINKLKENQQGGVVVKNPVYAVDKNMEIENIHVQLKGKCVDSAKDQIISKMYVKPRVHALNNPHYSNEGE